MYLLRSSTVMEVISCLIRVQLTMEPEEEQTQRWLHLSLTNAPALQPRKTKQSHENKPL